MYHPFINYNFIIVETVSFINNKILFCIYLQKDFYKLWELLKIFCAFDFINI